jgi:hypothetical protein
MAKEFLAVFPQVLQGGLLSSALAETSTIAVAQCAKQLHS